jgi:FkbM family methyltransferase
MFFDIGSNVGKWSLANIQACDKIISIEASPTTFILLETNCKPHDNIILLNYAVCNNGGNDIVFYQAQFDTLSTINKDWLTNRSSRFCDTPYTEIVCKTIHIDQLIEQYGKPDLIKIDVEGGEYECIISLTQKVNLLCFEWASEIRDIAVKCIDYLESLGYTQYYIQNGDDYVFRPVDSDYYDISEVKRILSNSKPKQDWGMVWVKSDHTESTS